MHSGWARHVATPAFAGKDAAGVMHFPGTHPEAAAWLLKERNVTGLAVDTLSLDHGASKSFKTHALWLPSGRWGLENVANLDKVPVTGAYVIALPMKIGGGSGGPLRIVALLP